jgi:hypothetical protein
VSSDVTARGSAHGEAQSSTRSRRPAYPWPANQTGDAILSADDPLAQNPHPGGPGSIWYADPSGASCIYSPRASPRSSPVCFLIVGNGQPALDAVTIAESAADRMDLSLAPIAASPNASSHGLTGERSWFWLEHAPAVQQLSVTVGPEQVTVTATPSDVTWLFGDGATRLGGAGVPYAEGDPPAAAIVHLYRTRCLSGDQGRNPYVLAQCTSNGYDVAAQVSWTFSFTATGPVATSGSLPARTTRSQLAYPVSEARGFLVGSNS